MSRPFRISIITELGNRLTLPTGPETFTKLGTGRKILFLGLGPDPAIAVSLTGSSDTVQFLENDGFISAMPRSWESAIPASWSRVGPSAFSTALRQADAVFFYTPNLKIHPSFWSPLFAQARLFVSSTSSASAQDHVWMPLEEQDLLGPELSHAFQSRGLKLVRFSRDRSLENTILSRLRQSVPKLFLSINFRGLDPSGSTASLLKAAGVPVAVWCVDNPFHLLSGVKSPFWRELHLFVSDPWFLHSLRELGAKDTRFLPLAAAPEFFQPRGEKEWKSLENLICFVGRSQFQGKSRFFAGSRIEPDLLTTARTRLLQGKRPDFGWWANQVGIQRMWPGNAVRTAGFGAEQLNQFWRKTVLGHLAQAGRLCIFGDAQWRDLLEGPFQLHREVDYYTALPRIYEHAQVSINLTSLLLPGGLTQRNFDVWAAGGFLLSDNTPGLELFPGELTREIRFATPEEATRLAVRFRKDEQARNQLAAAWREHILSKHTYAHRIDEILNCV